MGSSTTKTASGRPTVGRRDAPPHAARGLFAESALAWLVAGALAVLWTWPLALHLGEALPHDPRFAPPARGDVHTSVWGLFWAADSLVRGVRPFHTDLLFAPAGHGLLLHPHTYLWGALAAPIERAFGAPFAYGCVLLALIATTGAATYALARTLGLRRSAAGLAAFAYAFSPYFMQEGLGRLHLTANPLVPLAVLAAWRWRAGKGRAHVAAAVTGAFLGATLLVDVGAFAWTAMLVALVALFAPRRGFDGSEAERSSRFAPRTIASPSAWALFAAAGAVTGSPWLAAAASAPRGGEERSVVVDALEPAGARLVDFVTPPGLHPLLRKHGAPSLGAARPHAESTALRREQVALYLPLALLVFVAVAGARSPPSRRWLALAAVPFVVAWDPGGVIGAFTRALTTLDFARAPTRAWPFAFLPLVLAAAAGFERLVARGGATRSAALVLLVFVALESIVAPYPLAPWRAPLVARAIGSERGLEPIGRDALLALPIVSGPSVAHSWQTVHRHPTPFGHLARVESRTYARLVRLAPALLGASLGGPLPLAEEARIELDLLGVAHVLLDTTVVSDADDWIDVLDAVPGFERRPEGEDASGRVGADGVLGWSRRRAAGPRGS